MLDDREVRGLLVATAARDPRAFETLYRLTSPLLLGIAMRVVNRRELAEEVLHDAFIKIWRSADRFDPTAAKPVAWLAAIVRNRAIDLVASADQARVTSLGDDAERTYDEAMDALVSAQDGAEADQRAVAIRDCLAELKGQERQSLVLAYHHGLSHSELAQHLGKPLGTVKTWVRKALENLGLCVETCLREAR